MQYFINLRLKCWLYHIFKNFIFFIYYLFVYGSEYIPFNRAPKIANDPASDVKL